MYKKLKNIITEQECNRIINIIKTHHTPIEHPRVHGTKEYYNTPEFSILLGLLCDKLSKLTKKKLKPTYGFCRIYYKDCELKPHKDRPSCEYSLTINLYQTHKWGIFFDKKQFILNVGEAVLYKGCEVEHYRKKFEGEEYIQLFLHYVDMDGPMKEYGLVTQIPDILNFNFLNINPYLAEYLEVSDAFSIDECNFLKNQNFETQPGRVGKDIGILSDIRKSYIYWIPKINQWKGLFEKIMSIVEQCNREYFKFEITSLSENLQYTEYDSSYNGQYEYHIDIGNSYDSGRKLSISVQLSDETEYDGGELEFKTDYNKKYATKKQGSVIIFPSYILHKVHPVTRGKRCSLVTWVAGPPFR
jgi:PKHD-type hydroxylase